MFRIYWTFTTYQRLVPNTLCYSVSEGLRHVFFLSFKDNRKKIMVLEQGSSNYVPREDFFKGPSVSWDE
jgi:hypothetical protein